MLTLCMALLGLHAPVVLRTGRTIAPSPVVCTPAPTWGTSRLPNSPSEYDLNVGKLVDMLRRDTPTMLVAEPDLSLFTEQVEFGAFGTSVRGIEQYRKALSSLRWANKVAVDNSEIGVRLVLSGGTIRVRWNARLWMKALGRSTTEPTVIDGISIYELDAKGRVRAHRVENVATHGGQLSPALSSGLTGAWGTLVATPECIPC